MINISNALLFFTAYLTFCCCVYQICLWYPFGINGLEMINFSDIIQTTFIRLGWTFFYFLSFGLIQLLIEYDKKYDRSNEKFYKNIFIKNLIVIVIFLTVSFNFIDVFYWRIFLASSIAYMAGSFGRLEGIMFNKEYGTIISKNIIICAIIFLGIDSAVTGYQASLSVKNNESYMYTEIAQKQDSSKIKAGNVKYSKIKFLGFKSSGEFVFISMNNKDIYFIKNDTIKLNLFNK